MQAKHAVLPVSFMNVPGSQSLQESTPAAALAVPRGQGRHAAELVAPLMGWYVPTLQLWQPALELSPMVSDHVPGTHCRKADALLAPGSSQ